MKLRNSSQTVTLSQRRFFSHKQQRQDAAIIHWAIYYEMNHCVNSFATLLVAVGVLGRAAVVPEVMDPLGARSQFVDIQTLPTWQQQHSGDTRLDQSSGLPSPQAFPSPFPFRPDVNRKIILVWVTWTFLQIVAVVKKCPWFSLKGPLQTAGNSSGKDLVLSETYSGSKCLLFHPSRLPNSPKNNMFTCQWLRRSKTSRLKL